MAIKTWQMFMDCWYLAAEMTSRMWVRYESCQMIDNKIYVGIRPEARYIISRDTGKCIDGDPRIFTRYRIGEYEWICLKQGVK
jgi:hypothetical protein